MKTRTTILYICFIFASQLLFTHTAFSQEGPGGNKKSWFESISVNGFLSTAFSYNLNKPGSGKNGYRVFDFDDNSIKLDAFELSLKKDVAEMGDAGFRFDLMAGSSIPKVAKSGGFNAGDVDVHQAYLSYIAPLGSGLRFDIGKFITPHGYELIDGYDGFNDNYSRSFLFGYAIPFTHTGVRATYAFSSAVSAQLMVVNGWDNSVDNNKSKTVGAQIALTPTTGMTIYANYMYGPEKDKNNSDNRSLIDLVAMYAISDLLTVGVNGDFGSEQKSAPDDKDASWTGFAGYLRLNLSKSFAFIVRAEMFDDKDGVRTGVAQKLQEFTLTPEYRVSDNFVLRADVRMDSSDKEVFEKGMELTDKQTTVALNAIFLF